MISGWNRFIYRNNVSNRMNMNINTGGYRSDKTYSSVYDCWRWRGIPMKRQAVCAVCGQEFIADRVTQKYCSSYCRRYAHRHGANNHVRSSRKKEALRTFRCLKCGKLVRVTEPTDRRIKFCSAHCERLYWKHSKKVSSVVIRRSFQCRNCGTFVEITEPKDKRTIFCSQACREKWFSLHRNKNTLHVSVKRNSVDRRDIV